MITNGARKWKLSIFLLLDFLRTNNIIKLVSNLYLFFVHSLFSINMVLRYLEILGISCIACKNGTFSTKCFRTSDYFLEATCFAFLVILWGKGKIGFGRGGRDFDISMASISIMEPLSSSPLVRKTTLSLATTISSKNLDFFYRL